MTNCSPSNTNNADNTMTHTSWHAAPSAIHSFCTTQLSWLFDLIRSIRKWASWGGWWWWLWVCALLKLFVIITFIIIIAQSFLLRLFIYSWPRLWIIQSRIRMVRGVKKERGKTSLSTFGSWIILIGSSLLSTDYWFEIIIPRCQLYQHFTFNHLCAWGCFV